MQTQARQGSIVAGVLIFSIIMAALWFVDTVIIGVPPHVVTTVITGALITAFAAAV